MASSSFDYDVIVIGSGFGGSVAAMRAVEKGYKTAVLEAGKRWTDDELPKTNWHVSKFAWQPELEMFGIQRVRYLDDVIVLSGAGVGGGSLVYANTLYYPHDKFFNAPTWSHLADWKAETAACYDLTQRMFGVMPSPYMDTDGDRIVKSVAMDMNRPYVRAPLGIYFGTPGVEADDPYFGGAGPRRTGCISCGGCMSGCAYNAKNKLTTNYLYLAEKRGADVKDLHEVHELKPLDGGGFEVVARHPGLLGRAERHHHYTAQQVVVSAHAFGTAQLLMHMKHKGHLDKLSDEIGKRARTNSEALISVSRSEGNFKADPQRHHIVPGTSAVTAAIQADEESTMGPCYYNVGSDAMALLFTGQTDGTEHPFHAFVKELVHHPGKTLSIDDARQWSQRGFVMLCMRDHDDWLDPSLGARHAAVETRLVGCAPTDSRGRERCLETRRRQARRPARRDLVRRRRQGNVVPLHRRNDDGDSADQGVIDPYQRAFGYPGLHIMDGSVIAANPGVNPSLTISALAERAMSFWPNKGDEDARPPLGSGYDRIQPVMPHAPIVPKGAPAEYRLNATEVDDLTLTWDPAASR